MIVIIVLVQLLSFDNTKVKCCYGQPVSNPVAKKSSHFVIVLPSTGELFLMTALHFRTHSMSFISSSLSSSFEVNSSKFPYFYSAWSKQSQMMTQI